MRARVKVLGALCAMLLLGAIFAADTEVGMVLHTRGIKGELPVTAGVPMPEGMLKDVNNLALSMEGKDIYAQRAVTARWHTDNSIKWVKLDCIIPSTGAATEALTLTVGKPSAAAAPARPALATESTDSITVNTGAIKASLSKKNFTLFSGVELADGNSARLIAATGRDSGVYCVTSNGTAYYSGNDAGSSVYVEEKGPVRVCVRAEGWLVSASGEKNCRHITRMYFYAGQPLVKVSSTFIITADTDKIYFKDIGLKIGGLSAKDVAFTFGKPLALPAYAIQYEHNLYKLYSKGACVANGDRLSGAVSLSLDNNQNIGAAIANCWQKYPKEIEALPNALVFHAWPAHNEQVAEPEPSIYNLDRLWAQHHGSILKMASPPNIAQFPASGGIKEKELRYARASADNNGMGVAITNHFYFDFSGKLPLNQWTAANPLCVADPAWLCSSGAFGPLAAAQTGQMAYVENAMKKSFDWERGLEKSWNDYGMWIYGNSHTYFNITEIKDGRVEYNHLDRPWRNMHHGYPRVPWLMLARTGDPQYYDYGVRNAECNMDVGVCHWQDDAYNARFPENSEKEHKRKIKGAQTDYKGLAPWSAGGRIADYNSMTDYMLYFYYLTGNRRGLEVAKEWGECVKKNRPTPLDYAGRGWMGPLDSLLQLYLATLDREYLTLAEKYIAKIKARQEKDGTFYDSFWWSYAPGIINYYRITKDPAAAGVLLRWADSFMRYNRVHYNTSNNKFLNAAIYDYDGFVLGFPQYDVLAEAFRMTGDDKYLKAMKGRMILTADSFYSHNNSILDGYPANAGHSVYGYFLQLAPYGLQELAGKESLIPEFPRWDSAGSQTYVLKHPKDQSLEISFDYMMPQGCGYVRLEDANKTVMGTYRFEQTEAVPSSVKNMNIKIPPRQSDECMMQIVFEKQGGILLPAHCPQPVKMVRALPSNKSLPLGRGTSLYLQTTGKPSFEFTARTSVPASFAMHDINGGRLDYAVIWGKDNLASATLNADTPLPPGTVINLIVGLSTKDGVVKAMSGVAPYAAARADEFFIPQQIRNVQPVKFDLTSYNSALLSSNNQKGDAQMNKTVKTVASAIAGIAMSAAVAGEAGINIDQQNGKLNKVTISTGSGSMEINRRERYNTELIAASGQKSSASDPLLYSMKTKDLTGFLTSDALWPAISAETANSGKTLILTSSPPDSGMEKKVSVSIKNGENVLFVENRTTVDKQVKFTGDFQALQSSQKNLELFVDGNKTELKSGEIKDCKWVMFYNTRGKFSYGIIFCPGSGLWNKTLIGDASKPVVSIQFGKTPGTKQPGYSATQRYILAWGDGNLLEKMSALAKQVAAGELDKEFYQTQNAAK